jgi:transketolase
VQDLAILRTLPGITVLSPGDPGETRECVTWLTEHPGPSYLRIGKAGEKVLHEVRGIDRGLLPVRLTADRRMALVSTGGILDEVLKAADQLAAAGTSVSVFSAPWIKPMSAASVAALAPFEAVITVEEHIAEGGLASALREALPPGGPAIHSLAASAEIAWQVGSQAWLRAAAGISSDHIAARCRALLG